MGRGTPVVFGIDVLAQPQIDLIVLIFLFTDLGNDGLKWSLFGPQVHENWSFSPLKLFRGHYEHPVDNQFLNINLPRRVAKFGENRFKNVEKSADRKK